MFRIAICDDQRVICNEIEHTIENFFETESIQHETDTFVSGEALLKELKNKERYDLIYLDIELDVCNGVEIGRYIREELLDDFTQIAFISAKSSYALELFQIRPIHFLVKPFTHKQVIAVLEKALELQGRQTKIFRYRSGKLEKKISYKDIMYFSSDGKKVIIHMRDQEDYFYGKLSELQLPSADFVQIHQSFIVNKQYITQFKFDCVLLSNTKELPISRKYRSLVKENLIS